MNFDSLREKLRASAVQAAQAAREFEGLDAMAAQDDYIHKDESNVASKNRLKEAQQQEHLHQQLHQQQQYIPEQQSHPQHMLPNQYVDHHDQDDTSTLSTHSSLVKRVPSKANSRENKDQQPANQKDYYRSNSLQDIVPLKVSVPDRQLSVSVPASIETPSSSSYNDEYEDDASNSSEEDDPIMSLIRKQKGGVGLKKAARNAGASSASPLPLHSQSPHLQRTPKQKHRFMEDLDSRLAMENLQPLIASPGRPLRPTVGESAKEPPLPTGASWFSSVAAKSIEFMGKTNDQPPSSSSFVPVPLLSRAKWRQHPSQDNADELANVAVVSSTAMLGDEEMRELTQLRSQQQSFSMTSLLWNVVRDHPRESFIVFTLLLGSYVYLRSGGSV